MALKIKSKEVVVPGETLAEGMDIVPSAGAYRKDNIVLSSKFGLAEVNGNVIRVIPLSGVYIPKIGDVIIGEVIDVLISGWRLNIKSPYSAVLGLKDATSEFVGRGTDITRFFDVGDIIVTKIRNVTSQKLVDLTMRGPGLRKLSGGRIVDVNTNKIPRIIGKDGSMVSMIKEATGCNIIAGQNGWVWINGEPEKEIIAANAIKKVEAESHLAGLTDKIKKFLSGG